MRLLPPLRTIQTGLLRLDGTLHWKLCGGSDVNLDSPLVSVIVPTYNRPDLLHDALVSVSRQTWQSFECIVVDDGTGTAAAVVERFDGRYRLVDLPENVGNYEARNIGLRCAVGDVVTFLDDDDLYSPDRLAAGINGVRSTPVGICGSAQFTTSRDGIPEDLVSGKTRLLSGSVYDSILDETAPPVGATTLRASVVEEFDGSYPASGDLEWWLRTAAHPVTTIDSEAYLVRRHDGIRSTNGIERRIQASERLLQEHAKYFSKHRRARAFRQYRLAIMCQKLGNRRDARQYALDSVRSKPSLRATRLLLRL